MSGAFGLDARWERDFAGRDKGGCQRQDEREKEKAESHAFFGEWVYVEIEESQMALGDRVIVVWLQCYALSLEAYLVSIT